ncbi:MAG: Fe-S oxidoreductase [Acidobacteriota bacterium]|nr:Fe-S oxidoreductase [Acidobacteriota bacterium]
MTDRLSPQLVRDLRPTHEPPEPWRPIGVVEEQERGPAGAETTATLFLAGAQCPYTCVFCDLWRFTLAAPTPAGAIPAQIEKGLAALVARPRVVKLYNASNFFDPRAVPESDDDAIFGQLAGLERVVVECHPHLVDERARRYASGIDGRLEIAMGLETADPSAHAKLGKGTTVRDFERCAETLAHDAIDLRIFALIGTPYVAPEAQLQSAVATVAAASAMGARHVALVPTRGGNGALERLGAAFQPPDLDQIEDCFDACLALSTDAVVTVDLWDLELHASCESCLGQRRKRLAAMNLDGVVRPRHACSECASRRP